jgi:hypothetical protein
MTHTTWTMIARTNSVCTSTIHLCRGALLSLVAALMCLLGPGAASVMGQNNDPLSAIGVPPFVTALPVENGYIAAANGNLHLEFPMGSFPQRNGPPVTLALIYDSTIWPQNNCCNISGIYWPAGWKFVNSAAPIPNIYNNEDFIPGPNCSLDGIDDYDTFKNFYWTDPYGTIHYFNVTTVQGNLNRCGDYRYRTVSSGNAFANDASGYHIYVTGVYNSTVYSPDGTVETGNNFPKNTNGNYFSASIQHFHLNGCLYSCDFPVANVTDTAGRSFVTTSLNGNTLTFQVLNSQGGTSTYTVTLQTINVHTNFIATDPHLWQDASGSLTVIQSIALPDGTSYQFGYDSGTTPGYYGQLTSITLPTGAQTTYQYSNFADSEIVLGGAWSSVHITRGVSQRVTPDGTWTYVPAVILQCTSTPYMPSGCKQQLTVTKPIYNGRSDNVVYKFVLYPKSGAYPYEADFYNGAVSPANLLATMSQTWYYTRLIASTISLPAPGGTINQTTQSCVDFSNYAGNLKYRYLFSV